MQMPQTMLMPQMIADNYNRVIGMINQSNMERLSILIDKRHLDLSKEVGYNIEKAQKFLCEHCGVILSTKQSLKYGHNTLRKSHYLPMM